MKNRIFPGLVGVLVAGAPLYGGCAGFNVLDSTSTTLVETLDSQGRIIYTKDGKLANGTAGQTQQYDANQKTSQIEQQLKRYKDDVELDTTVDANGNIVESVKKKVTKNTDEVNKLANQSELDNLSRGVASIAATDKAVKDSLSTKASWVDYATQEQNVYGQKNAAGQRINSGINGKIVSNAQAIDGMARTSTGSVSKLEGQNYGTSALSTIVTIGSPCGKARANGDLARTASGIVAVCHGNVWKHGVTTKNEIGMANFNAHALSDYLTNSTAIAYGGNYFRIYLNYTCGEKRHTWHYGDKYRWTTPTASYKTCPAGWTEVGRATRTVFEKNYKTVSQKRGEPTPSYTDFPVSMGCTVGLFIDHNSSSSATYYYIYSVPRVETGVGCVVNPP